MILSRIFKNVNSKTSINSAENMKNWIDENQFFNDICDPNNYSTLNIRSLEIIMNFYLDKGFLNNQEIDNFWMAMNLGFNIK